MQTTATEPTMIQTRNIFPPHEVRDSAKLASLVSAMESDGWQGRPLLVVEYGDVYVGLTGSHRYAAADAAGVEEVPCVTVDGEKLTAAGYSADDLKNATDDWDVLNILEEIDDPDAIALMQTEIDNG